MGGEEAVFAGRNPEEIVTLAWSPAARRDFASIVDYIADDDPAAAVEQGDEIQHQVAGLERHHSLGRPGRVNGTRELIIARTPYIAVYRVLHRRVEILRILHGAQQWPAPF